MGLDDVIRGAVAVAKTVTSDLQPSVTHEAWTGSGAGYGKSAYAVGVAYPALVERKHGLVSKAPAGELREVQAKITFLEPVTPNGATGRTEPIDPRDILTLPDGTTGPILKTAGFISKSTGRPYLTEVWLGYQGLR